VGANSNIDDVSNLNSVSIRAYNSAGLITVSSGSGLSSEEHDKLMLIPALDDIEASFVEIPPLVRTELASELDEISKAKAFVANRLRVNKETGDWTVYDDTGVFPLYTGTISDDGTFKDRVPA